MGTKSKINKLIQEQLEKCCVTDISHLDYNTYTLIIPQIKKIKLEVNGNYIVKIDKSAMAPSMFNSNWNRGLPPTSEYMQIDVSQIVSQAIKFNGIEYNPETNSVGTKVWSGWVMTQCMEVLSKL